MPGTLADTADRGNVAGGRDMERDRALRVLIVEDDEEDALLLREMLGETPAPRPELTVVGRLGEAMERVGEERFDAVLLDLKLPDSQGLDTFADLHHLIPEVPVVVMTGLDDSDMARRAVQAGAQDYLVKGQVNGPALLRSVLYAIERQRTVRYRALLLERERFDTAVSQMSDAIVVTDETGEVTTANHAACLLLNLPEGRWKGLPLWAVLGSFETSVPLVKLRTETEPVSAFEISRPNTHPPLYLDARLTRLSTSPGVPESMVLTLRDVTDERHRRNIQANFIVTVSHKLRTPLTIISGWLQVCERMPPERLAEQWHRVREILSDELQELSDAVQRLLEFKEVTTQELAAHVTNLRLDEVAWEVAEEVKKRYPAKEVRVQVRVTGDPSVQVSRENAAFVLEQLIGNAVKFGDKTPVEVTVEIEPLDAAWCRCTVRDNGPGVPHEYYDRIFDGFFQVEDHVTGQVPGMGVGLHMARQIVAAHGGQISVESQIGLGSAFAFTLPRT
jgi:signal transduction histidine kinase